MALKPCCWGERKLVSQTENITAIIIKEQCVQCGAMHHRMKAKPLRFGISGR